MAKKVLGALKSAGEWLAEHPDVALGVVDKAKKLIPTKEDKTTVASTDAPQDKADLLRAAVSELEQKTSIEMKVLRSELKILHVQMRAMKIMLIAMGVVLGMAIIAIILLAIFK